MKKILFLMILLANMLLTCWLTANRPDNYNQSSAWIQRLGKFIVLTDSQKNVINYYGPKVDSFINSRTFTSNDSLINELHFQYLNVFENLLTTSQIDSIVKQYRDSITQDSIARIIQE